eukprot:1041199-Ditylum_brightwellii.AAC.1
MQSKYGCIVTSDDGEKVLEPKAKLGMAILESEGDDIFCRIERQLQAIKDGLIDLENAISRALKFIEGERDEIVAQKDAATSKIQDITDKNRKRKTNTLLCRND